MFKSFCIDIVSYLYRCYYVSRPITCTICYNIHGNVHVVCAKTKTRLFTFVVQCLHLIVCVPYSMDHINLAKLEKRVSDQLEKG